MDVMALYGRDYAAHINKKTGYRGFINRVRNNTFSALIEAQPKERILEIGCNAGVLLRILQSQGAVVSGIDVDKNILETIKDLPVFYMSVTELDFPENSFDKVCAFEVLEHIEELRKALENIARILKPGGRFYCSFPFELIRGQAALYDALTVYHNALYARKLHVHKLTPSKIKKWIAGLPLEIVASKMIFIPFPSFFMTLKKK